MKKKQALAVLLAATMVTGTCMTATAAETETETTAGKGTEGHGGDGHGTKGEALISGATSEMTIGNPEGDTQFYIKIDKDASSGNVPIPGTGDYTASGDICHYEVEWDENRNSTLSVTVPLYVCMYGYGGDGRVVTPQDGAYSMVNDSTYTDSKEVTDIIGCYKVNKLDKNTINTITEKATTEEEKGKLVTEFNKSFLDLDGGSVTIGDTQYSGEWGYFTSNNAKYLVRLSDCDIHTEDSGCENKDNYFYRDSKHKFLTEGGATNVTVTDDDNNTLSVGTTLYANRKEKNYLPVNVPTISAERNTWNILPMSDANDLAAGDIAMTINGVDMSDVINSNDNGDEQTLDIRDLKWTMPTEKEAELSLPVRAVIAGGNVNEEGCVPVVKVIYKVSPARDLIKDTTYGPIKPPPSDES